MAKIKTLKDKGEVFYPQTHIEAVVDDNGNTVTGLIDQISREIAPLETEIDELGNKIDEESERAVAKETELAGEIQRVENVAESKQDKLVSGTNIKTINGQPVLGSGNINITSETATSIIEPNVKFANGNEGNTDIMRDVTPTDAARYSFFSANRLNFMNVVDDLEIEFSRDKGKTWYPYPNDINSVSDSIPQEYELVNVYKKTKLVSDISVFGEEFFLGGRKNTQDANDMLRITISAHPQRLYFKLNKILIAVCAGGMKNMRCNIDAAMCGSSSIDGTEDVFVNIKQDVRLDGWTDWNSIALTNAFGGSANQTTQYRKIRITVFGDGIADYQIGKSIASVQSLRMFGNTVWLATNEIQKSGRLYTIDVNKKATFPAPVVAPSFEGIATSVVDGAISTSKLGNSAVTSDKIKDNEVIEKKLSTDVQTKLNANSLKESVANIYSRLGHNAGTITLKASDLLPIVWNGTKMVSSPIYSIWILPLSEGGQYDNIVDQPFIQSRRTCNVYPALDKTLTMEHISSSSFTATSETKFLVITVTMSDYDGSDYLIEAGNRGVIGEVYNLMTELEGISEQIDEVDEFTKSTKKQLLQSERELESCIGSKNRTIVLTSNDYDNIVWNGTKFTLPSSDDYNGFVIPIYPGEKIKCLVDSYANNVRTTTEYPTNGSSDFIRTKSELTDEFIVQENEHYLFINTYNPKFTSYEIIGGIGSIKSQLDSLEILRYPLLSKTILCLGDSITENKGIDDKRYSDYLAEITGANIINGGIGGTQMSRRREIPSTFVFSNNSEAYACLDLPSIAHALNTNDFTLQEAAAEWLKSSDDNTSIIERLKNVDLNAVDIVTIFIGTNDIGARLGEIGEKGGENSELSSLNISQGFHEIIKNLLTKNPNLRIYYFSPMPRYFGDLTIFDPENADTDADWCDNRTASFGYTFPEMVDHQIKLAKHYKIPVCDMYRTLGINQWNIASIMKENNKDGTHPYRGYKMIANKIASFITANNLI